MTHDFYDIEYNNEIHVVSVFNLKDNGYIRRHVTPKNDFFNQLCQTNYQHIR